MKKFGELTLTEFEQVVNNSDKLLKELDDYIQDCEFDWLHEKVAYIKKSLADYQIGFNCHCYIKIKDYGLFVDCVKLSYKAFGLSERAEKKLAQCEKLQGTNLFEYQCEQLKEMYFEDELQLIIDYAEDCGMEIYNGEIGDKCRDCLEDFRYRYDNWLYDEENGIIYSPTKLSAA